MSTVTLGDIQEVMRLESSCNALAKHASRHYMKYQYSAYLNGGWLHEDGRWITRGHDKAQSFHQACAQLRCPACWSVIGYMGSDPDEMFRCKKCQIEYPIWGKPDERASWFDLLFISGGNQSSKTFTMITEFCAWIEGKRPWDGSLTCQIEEPGDWLITSPSHTEHFPKVIIPYFEERMGHRIIDRIKDNSKALKRYVLDIDGRIDTVSMVSMEQVKRAGSDMAGPLEGSRVKGVACDEPPLRKAMAPMMRGLLRWQAAGWGRMMIAGTSVDDEHLFNRVYQRSWNKGGDVRRFYSTEFGVDDNPSLTEIQRENLRAMCTPEEAEMRIHGRFRALAGRIYSTFEESVHTVDEETFDPLTHWEDQDKDFCDRRPSDWPVVLCVDPHDVRPFAMVWVAIAPNEDFWTVREWPNQHYPDLRRSNMGFQDYFEVIEEIELNLPGGHDRVVRRFMDPHFGPAAKMGTRGQSIQEVFRREHGLYFDCKINADIPLRHARVRDLLRYSKKRPLGPLNKPKAYFLTRCRNMIWSLRNYTNKKDMDLDKSPDGRPSDTGKDFCDAFGWMAVKAPGYSPWDRKANMKEYYEKRARGWARSGAGVRA